jgi:hypothetical protein
MGTYAAYFEQAGQIWQDYFDGKISVSVRDGRLRWLKDKWNIK